MQSDDADLLMERNLNGDAGAYFKRIEIYKKLSQTGRPCVRVGAGEEGRIHSADVCWDFGAEQEDFVCVTVCIKTNVYALYSAN